MRALSAVLGFGSGCGGTEGRARVPWRRTGIVKRWITIAFAVVLVWGLPVAAQMLVEVQLTTAIALKPDSQIRLPSGSYRAVGQGVGRPVVGVRPLGGRRGQGDCPQSAGRLRASGGHLIRRGR